MCSSSCWRFLLLEAVRRHGESGEVSLRAFELSTRLIRINNALAATAVENGALELLLATVRDTRSCPDAVLAALSLKSGLIFSGLVYAAHAIQLGIVEVRCLVHDVSSPNSDNTFF